jgi:hypothetical protein
MLPGVYGQLSFIFIVLLLCVADIETRSLTLEQAAGLVLQRNRTLGLSR